MKEFRQRENVLNHVRNGKTACRQQLLLGRPVLTAGEADALDVSLRDHNRALSRKGLRRHAKDAPCVRLSGPLPLFRHGPISE